MHKLQELQIESINNCRDYIILSMQLNENIMLIDRLILKALDIISINKRIISEAGKYTFNACKIIAKEARDMISQLQIDIAWFSKVIQ